LSSRQVAYSVVNMSLNGGLGVVTQKNLVLHPAPLTSEKLCATQHANGIDYWIMTHDNHNNFFRAFLLTAAGVNPSPVISKIGKIYDTTTGVGFLGNMRFSPSGCKLATTFFGKSALDTIEVFNFDKATGYVFNVVQLNILGGWSPTNPA